MKTITLVATFQARPGKEVALRAALISLLAPTRKEAGCVSYDLHELPGDPTRFLFYENWANQAAIDAHMGSPQIQALLPRVDELCTEFPQITAWARVE